MKKIKKLFKEKEVVVSWKKYVELLKTLAKKVKKEINPSQIICIAKGGLNPGIALSMMFKLPLGIVAVQSYGDNRQKNKKEFFFCRYLVTTSPGLGSKVLLVDDLTQSGETLERTRQWLMEEYKSQIKEIKTAVIWHKETSNFRPDFFVQEIKKDKNGECPWIVQPIEVFENVNLEDL